jgi:hypothetical protein
MYDPPSLRPQGIFVSPKTVRRNMCLRFMRVPVASLAQGVGCCAFAGRLAVLASCVNLMLSSTVA